MKRRASGSPPELLPKDVSGPKPARDAIAGALRDWGIRDQEAHPSGPLNRQALEAGLLLQGAGSLAAYEAGMVACLYDRGVRARVAAGTAMGALNAAIVGGNAPDRVSESSRQMWMELGGWSGNGTDRLLELLMKFVDFEFLRSSRGGCRVAISACDIMNGAQTIFDRGQVSPEAVLASALPPPFPVEIDGRLYWGSRYVGASGLLPMSFALEGPIDYPIFSMRESFETDALTQIDTERERYERWLELLFVADYGGREVDFIGRLEQEKLRLGHKDQRISYDWLTNLIHIDVSHRPMSGVFNFSPDVLRERFERGYESANEFISTFVHVPRPRLPEFAREHYATFVLLGGEYPDIEVISVPKEKNEFASVLGSVGAPINSTDELISAVAEILARANTEHSSAGEVPAGRRSINEVAAGVVYNTTIPVSESPFKPWRFASLLKIPNAQAAVTRTDDTNQTVLVLAVEDSLVLAGAPGVARQFLNGRILEKGVAPTIFAPRFGPKRNLNAWTDDPSPTVGKSFHISINIGAPRSAAAASAPLNEPDWRGMDFIDLIVAISCMGCVVRPDWQELRLPRIGDSDTIDFEITGSVPGNHEFSVSVYLAKQMIRLQLLSFTVAIEQERFQPAGMSP
jgi:hypothetical protein